MGKHHWQVLEPGEVNSVIMRLVLEMQASESGDVRGGSHPPPPPPSQHQKPLAASQTRPQPEQLQALPHTVQQAQAGVETAAASDSGNALVQMLAADSQENPLLKLLLEREQPVEVGSAPERRDLRPCSPRHAVAVCAHGDQALR